MRRWSGWGDEAVALSLMPAPARRFLVERLGAPQAISDAVFFAAAACVPAAHKDITAAPEARLRMRAVKAPRIYARFRRRPLPEWKRARTAVASPCKRFPA